MPEKIQVDLKDVQKTLLLPLWGRAMETAKESPRLRDEKAAEIIEMLEYDFSMMANNIIAAVACISYVDFV